MLGPDWLPNTALTFGGPAAALTTAFERRAALRRLDRLRDDAEDDDVDELLDELRARARDRPEHER